MSKAEAETLNGRTSICIILSRRELVGYLEKAHNSLRSARDE